MQYILSTGLQLPMDEPKRKVETGAASMATAMRYLGLAFVIPLSAGGGWQLGAYLDRTLKTNYWGIVLLLLAIIGSLVQVIRELNRDSSK